MTNISTLIRMTWVDNLQGLLRGPISDDTARELHIASTRITAQCANLLEVRTKIAASSDATLIDSALSIENELEQVKESMRDIRRQILRMLESENTPSPEIHSAITSLRKAAEETYTAANQLQWEIAEHDASHAPRGKPMIATNEEELDKALNSIRSAK